MSTNSTAIPANNHTTTTNSTTTPANSTATPANNQTTTANSTAIPANSTATPANSTATPVNNQTTTANGTAMVPSPVTTVPSPLKIEDVIAENYAIQIILIVCLVGLCIFANFRKRLKMPMYYSYNHIAENDIETVSMVGCSEHYPQSASKLQPTEENPTEENPTEENPTEENSVSIV